MGTASSESGRTWCQLLDAVRLGPADDAAEVTAVQLRRVVQHLISQGRWREGDADILIVCDAGYDAPRLAYLLGDLPVEVLGRLRSDRVMRRPATRTTTLPQGGRIPKHGPEFRLAMPQTWGEPDAATVQATERYGLARTMAWDHIHPRLRHLNPWIDHHGELPVLNGTLIRLEVDRLPGDATPVPVWLWSSRTGLTGTDVDIRWQAFLRRFDLEHTFRMIKTTLGWTRPKLRTPEAADRCFPRGLSFLLLRQQLPRTNGKGRGYAQQSYVSSTDLTSRQPGGRPGQLGHRRPDGIQTTTLLRVVGHERRSALAAHRLSLPCSAGVRFLPRLKAGVSTEESR